MVWTSVSPPDRAVEADHRVDAGQRIEQDLVGHERTEDQDREDRLRPAEFPERHGIAGDRAGHDGEEDTENGDLDRVQEARRETVAAQARAGRRPGDDPRIEGRLLRQRQHVADADFRHRLQRRHDHHIGRNEEEDRRRDEDRVERNPADRQAPDRPSPLVLPPAASSPEWRQLVDHGRIVGGIVTSAIDNSTPAIDVPADGEQRAGDQDQRRRA